jgi:hypothetical protein
MPAGRTPGPYCAHNNPQLVDDGTMCRVPSPPPVPVGSRDGGFQESCRCLFEAYGEALPLAPSAVYRETGYQLGSLLSGLIPGLLEMLAALGVSTVAGAGIGAVIGFFAGGAGAIPGAAVGADLGFDAGMAILTWLGVGFLLKSIGTGMAELTALVYGGSQRAWHAGGLPIAERNNEIQRAAQDLAKAVGVLVRLLLQGVVAYLLKNAAVTSSRAAMATGQGVRTAGSEAAADQAVAELVSKLRASKLGDGFAKWVEKNWKDLVKDPRLRPRTAGGGGAAPEPAAVAARPREASRPGGAAASGEFVDGTVPPGQRTEAATSWYAQQPGMTAEKAAQRATGFNPDAPMEIKTLPPGTKLQQWVRNDGKPGLDFTTPGTDPASLGIPLDPNTGLPAGRSLQTFEVTQPLQVLQGQAADFEEGKLALVGGPGGGTQIAMPPGWQNSLQAVPNP